MDSKTIKVRHGIPMDAESLEAWKNVFVEIEESIEQLDLEEEIEIGRASCRERV